MGIIKFLHEYHITAQVIHNGLMAFFLVFIAWQQWRTAEKTRKQNQKKHYESNYKKISHALKLALGEAEVTPEVLALFWEAQDEACLYLSKKIEKYTKQLYERALSAYCIYNKTQLKINVTMEESDRNHEIITEFSKEKPNEKYRQFLKI